MSIIMAKSEEEILREFSKSGDVDELCHRYNKKQLVAIYYSIYGIKPLSRSTKEDIVKTLRHRAFTIERAKAFAELTAKR